MSEQTPEQTSVTPSGARIWAEHPDGTRIDVTEAVQVAYDLSTHSMDFGSGFLSVEEVVPLSELAQACGFDDDLARSYIEGVARHLRGATVPADRRERKAAEAWLDTHPQQDS